MRFARTTGSFLFAALAPLLLAADREHGSAPDSRTTGDRTTADPPPPSFEGKVVVRDVAGNFLPFEPPSPRRKGLGSPAGGAGAAGDVYIQDGSESALAVSFDDSDNLIATYNQGWNFDPARSHSASTDGNSTWTTRSFPVGEGTYTGSPFDPWAHAGNEPGEFYSSLIRRDVESENARCVIARSTDGGRTFSKFFERRKDVFQDRQMFDVDRTEARGGGPGSAYDGYLYLCYDDLGPEGDEYVGAFVQVISPSGAPVREIQISGTGNPPFRGAQLQPVAGVRDGQMYLLGAAILDDGATHLASFHELRNAGAVSSFDRSRLTWASAGQELGDSRRYGVNGHRIDTNGYLAIDRSGGPRRGHLYFVFNDNPNPGDTGRDQGDVSLAVSSDGAVSWGSIGLPGDTGKTQYFPMLDIDTQGFIHVAYYQNETGSQGGTLNASEANLYYTFSTDGGAGWSEPVQVNQPENRLRFEDPPPELSEQSYYLIGDYAQLRATGLAADTRVYVLWTGYDRDRSGEAVGEAKARVYCTTLSGIVAPGPRFLRGNCNGGGLDISDAIFSLNFQFTGGEAPRCIEACDSNGDLRVDISDPLHLLNYLFKGGPPPPAPFPECDGADSPDCAQDICGG